MIVLVIRPRKLDPLGMLTTFTYNSNSNVLSETKSGRTTQFQYDATLRRTKTIDALGQQIVTVYSSVADGKKPASVTDVRGQLTNFEYDARGDLIRTTFPDGSTTTTTYDNEGRALSKSDRDGRHMAFQYDALGRQTRITNPDGTTVNKTYDAVARLLTQTDERGNVTTYAYGPNKQTVFDALGNVTVHDFDSRERRTRTTDALEGSRRLPMTVKANLQGQSFQWFEQNYELRHCWTQGRGNGSSRPDNAVCIRCSWPADSRHRLSGCDLIYL